MAKTTARRSVSYDAVRKAALALPGVEEGTAWGIPAFRKDGTLFLCFREDLDAVVVRASFEQRDAMIAENPGLYFTTDHHRPHPWVLARIAGLTEDVIPGLVRLGWQSAPEKKRRAKSR